MLPRCSIGYPHRLAGQTVAADYVLRQLVHIELILDAGGREAEEAAKSVDLVDGEKFVRARKRVRDGLIENGVGPRIEKLVNRLLGPA